ncbi:aldehyde dehydrogenase (NADP(+)) [Mucilaginibacter sp. HD30]
MTLIADNFIGFKNSAKGEKTFQSFAPAKNEYLPEKFTQATEEEFEAAIALAQQAFPAYRELTYEKRAQFLDAIADEIMALGDALLERCSAESGLPLARITGERGRTCGQLKLFAQLLRDGWWLDARVDTAQPDRQPLPKSDIRRMLIPLGPVAVYGASNFPLAFSTAGGDTASALAAGCPVVVKSHSSHPGTNALVSSAIAKAAQATGMPEGVFSSIYLSHEHSVKLVQHPVIKAVGFTGSRHVGMTLFNAAVSRPEPIPVYAEMSAINPVVLMENALVTQKEKIAKALSGSVVMGVGQFCTNPGLILLVDSPAAQDFLTSFAGEFVNTAPGTMLNKNICKAYAGGIDTLKGAANTTMIAEAATAANADKAEARPSAFSTTAAEFLTNKALSEEVFGPATLFVVCKDAAELAKVLESLEGQLTATVHAADGDKEALLPVVSIITQKAGRVIYGGYPTGVEVCHSMVHGGPFPSTSNAASTSVGTGAILRFVRPVAFQDFPDDLLPEPLKKGNPLNILRLVDGNWTKDKA